MEQYQNNWSQQGMGSPAGWQGAINRPLRIAAFMATQQPGQRRPGYRPRIGILSTSGCMRDGGWPVYAGDAATVNAVFEAGGYPVIIPTLALMQGYDPFNLLADDDAFEEVFAIVWQTLRGLDGLLLAGGGDVYSCLYGHVMHPRAETPEVWRDIWERYFALAAWLLYLPTLGICRGMQVMNVVMGGDLFQDVRAQWPRTMPPLLSHRGRGRISADNWVEHPVTIYPKSRLGSIIRGREEKVPYRQHLEAVLSMHHQIVGYITPEAQIVGNLAQNLIVSATAPDGVIEGIEDSDPRRFWVAVQFHPEWVVYLGWSLRIFSALVEASAAYATLPPSLAESLGGEVCGWIRQCDRNLMQQRIGVPRMNAPSLPPEQPTARPFKPRNTDELLADALEATNGQYP